MSMLIRKLAAGKKFKSNADLLKLHPPKDYSDGRTKQAFKDETDINKILMRAQKTGTVSHVNKYEGRYADFSDFDFFETQLKLTEGRQIFDDLPSEIRNEFRQSPAAFFAYVNDPANQKELLKKLPGLAAPGRQNLDVRGVIPADEEKLVAQATEQPAHTAPVAAQSEKPPPAVPEGD